MTSYPQEFHSPAMPKPIIIAHGRPHERLNQRRAQQIQAFVQAIRNAFTRAMDCTLVFQNESSDRDNDSIEFNSATDRENDACHFHSSHEKQNNSLHEENYSRYIARLRRVNATNTEQYVKSDSNKRNDSSEGSNSQKSRKPNKQAAIVAEELEITINLVRDISEPFLDMAATNKWIGYDVLTEEDMYPCNGYESLLHILKILLDELSNAIDELIHSNRDHSASSWFSFKEDPFLDKVISHHAQLRAFYSILYLAYTATKKCSPTESLFLSIAEYPEFEPRKWRTAVKIEDFYGKRFGFHYKESFRKVLQLVNIARCSIDKVIQTPKDSNQYMSSLEDDSKLQDGKYSDKAQEDSFSAYSALVENKYVKNMTMLAWGWVYSNIKILNELGVDIESANTIGATKSQEASLDQVRTLLNLIEVPLVSGVSSLANTEIAIDEVFYIPAPRIFSRRNGLPSSSSRVTEAVPVRLLSLENRSISLTEENRMTTDDYLLYMGDLYFRSPRVYETQNGLKNKNSASSLDFTARERNSVNGKGKGREQGTSPEEPYSDEETLSRFASAIHGFLSPTTKLAKGLVIHFHGGGFISQSSLSHGSYLREWAGDIPDCIIASVDYKLAPENPYPIALQECFHVYEWLLNNCERLGTTAETIVLCGDSAGGNIAIALAMKLTSTSLRQPDGIVVAYPALFVHEALSPSRLLSFFDPLLPVSVLNVCLRSYIPEGADSASDPFISPVVATDDLLKKLPPVSIITGSVDPLLDDSIYFAHRMKCAGRSDTRVKVIPALPHGFLNMALISEDAEDAMHQTAAFIARYLEVSLKIQEDR